MGTSYDCHLLPILPLSIFLSREKWPPSSASQDKRLPPEAICPNLLMSFIDSFPYSLLLFSQIRIWCAPDSCIPTVPIQSINEGAFHRELCLYTRPHSSEREYHGHDICCPETRLHISRHQSIKANSENMKQSWQVDYIISA